jgi:hypothetical protein
MDAMKYREASFLRLDDLRHGAYEGVIHDVQEAMPRNKWRPSDPVAPRLALIFGDGRGLVLEARNLDLMIAAFGPETDGWLGWPVRVFIDTLPSTHGRGREVKRIAPVEADGPPFDDRRPNS